MAIIKIPVIVEIPIGIIRNLLLVPTCLGDTGPGSMSGVTFLRRNDDKGFFAIVLRPSDDNSLLVH